MTALVTDSWGDYLQLFPPDRRDVYMLPAYVAAHAREGVTVECFVRTEGRDAYLLPYLRADNDLLPGSFDLFSAYGYSGPISTTADEGFARRSFDEFRSEMKDRGAVSGFLRFDPVLANEGCVGDGCEVLRDRATVAFDLREPEEELWAGMREGTRRMTRRALGELAYEADEELSAMPQFVDLYRRTMERLGAERFYMFDGDYFERLKQGLGGHATLALVRSGRDLVSAGLFLHDGPYAHYHLGGSEESALKLRPNNLMLFGSALHFRERGFRVLHLGGGTDAEEGNSLLAFKRGLARGSYEFSVGKIVFDADKYERACEAFRQRGSVASGRFPEYGLGGRGERA